MGFWGLGIVVAPILGPVLGGWLTDNYSWRWVFYINIPVGIASIVMTKLYIFDPPYLQHASRAAIDYWGIGMLAVGIGALQIVLDKGQQDDWFSSHAHHDAGDRQRRHARRAHRPRADDRRSGRRSARVQGAQLRRRRVPDDGRRLRALRQHGAAADHAADAARLSVAAGRHRDGAARHRLVLHDADRRPADRPVRPAQAARGRADRRRRHAALARRSSTCRPATGTSSGRSSFRASACRCCSCR